jgi:rhodanese-related sulfurtransferase
MPQACGTSPRREPIAGPPALTTEAVHGLVPGAPFISIGRRATVNRVIRSLAALGAATMMVPAARPAFAEPPAGKQTKVCFTCHKTVEPGVMRGHFDDVSMKSRSFQLKLDGDVEVLAFDPATLQVVNATETGDPEKVLKAIRKGSEARVVYTLDGNVKRVSLLSLKPKLEVPAEKQVTTDELRKLVAMGPEEGKYFLFDARPAPKFAEGYIPTAESLPFPAFEKEKGKLPADKGALVVFYCAGVTCAMSPAARNAAEALGYTNAKVYHEGLPIWSKTEALALSPKLLKEAWLDKQQPIIVLDARKKTASGAIAGAAAFPEASKAALDKLYRFRKMKPPIVVYDEDGATRAAAIAKAVVAAGYPAMVLTGGVRAWKEAGYPLAGAPAKAIAFVPKPKAGEMPVADFKALVAAVPADTILLDVRNADEVGGGAFMGSVNIPADQLANRTAELSREKRIVAHCSTGLRAEMAYNQLKAAGFPRLAFLNASVEFEDGKPAIDE